MRYVSTWYSEQQPVPLTNPEQHFLSSWISNPFQISHRNNVSNTLQQATLLFVTGAKCDQESKCKVWKRDKEVSGKPMATKSWKRKHWLTCEAELLRFTTQSEIDPLRYLKWNCSASFPKAKLILFTTLSGIANHFDCRVIRSATLVQIEKLNYSASGR